MGEVSRVSGQPGPQEPGKDKKVSDEQKFRDMMKIDKVDEDQRKKRKQKGEAEAEAEANIEGAPLTESQTASKISPFSPESKLGKAGPMKAQAPAAPSESAMPKSAAPVGPEPTPAEDESFMRSLPTAAQRETAPREAAPRMPSTRGPEMPGEGLGRSERIQEHEKATETQETKAREHKRYKEAEKGAERAATKEEAVSRKEKREMAKAEAASRKEEQEAAFKGEAKKERERLEEAAHVPGTAAAAHEGKRKGEKKVEETSISGVSAAAGQTEMAAGTTAATPTPPASYAYLHPHVLELFERMVGVITVMSDAGITQTTLTLSNPEYAKSVFFGAQIIITEHPTAPKSFNVQLISSPQGVALINANIDDLMAAFQHGKYNFKINRIEASLSTEKPLFHRKEGVGKEGKGGTQK